MKVRETELPGVLLIEPEVFDDARGLFYESWSESRYADAGMPRHFVQDNISASSQGTLRGLHLQHPHGQGKLVQVIGGKVFDVAVDVRLGSPTFGRWTGLVLSEANRHQLYIPTGFAHGFCVISHSALFAYKCTDFYDRESELTVAWDDMDIGIVWPLKHPVLSKKDSEGRSLAELRQRLPRYHRSEDDEKT